jgi:hypothetical protein
MLTQVLPGMRLPGFRSDWERHFAPLRRHGRGQMSVDEENHQINVAVQQFAAALMWELLTS